MSIDCTVERATAAYPVHSVRVNPSSCISLSYVSSRSTLGQNLGWEVLNLRESN